MGQSKEGKDPEKRLRMEKTGVAAVSWLLSNRSPRLKPPGVSSAKPLPGGQQPEDEPPGVSKPRESACRGVNVHLREEKVPWNSQGNPGPKNGQAALG